MELTAAVTGLLLLQYFIFSALTGRARMQTGLPAPATTGNESFERWYRIQHNTLEQLMVALPSMWIFAIYVHALWAAALGLVFFIGRILYCMAYLRDPARRAPGFVITSLASAVLLLGGMAGAIMAMI